MAVESEGEGEARMDMRAVLAAIGRRWLRILLVTVLLLVATYAVLLFVPKLYESSASILVESRDNTYTRATNDNQPAAPVADAGTISSQIELIQSRDTLLPVIKSENLASVPEFNGSAQTPFSGLFRFFNRKSAASIDDVVLENLNERLTVIRERDSAIITILVRSTDPKLAASLANAIAKADVARRADQSLSDTADAGQWLKSQVDLLRTRVTDAESKVANFKVDNDLFTGTNNTSLLDQQMTDVSAQITAAQGRKNTAQSRADLIRGLLKAGQPLDGVTDIRDSVTIQQLAQQKATLQSQRAQLLATLLPNHPSVKAVVAQIAEVDKQITVEGRRVADALDAEAKVEAGLVTSLQGELTRLKGSSATATKQTVTLDELDREAKAERDLLESYLSRYRDATSRTEVNATLPDVRVVTLAAPTTTPVSPKTGFILGAVGFVAIALQVGSVLFGELMSGRALIDRREPPDLAPGFVGDEEVDAEMVEPPRAAAEPEWPASHYEPEPTAPAAARPVEDLEVPVAEAAPPRERRSLRSWFAKRARAVTPLSSYQPPEAFPPLGSEAVEPFASSTGADAWALAERIEPLNTPTFRITNPLDLSNLSADLALGRARVVILAALTSN